MATEAQKKAFKRYDKKARATYSLKLSKIADADIIEFLNGVDNKNEFLKTAIRKAMNKPL